jgi:hypothetical protein
MNDKLKTGLLVVIAAALLVNVYFLATGNNSEVVNPADTRASFERTPAATTAAQARQDAANAASAVDPMNVTQVSNEAVASGPRTSVKFDNMNHDFGTIYQDSENKKVFTFTNTGSEPLIIENAKGSCGCTVPKYPKEPIAPGQTGEIEVVYKPGKQKNKQTKNVTITANTTPANTVLTISADVLES